MSDDLRRCALVWLGSEPRQSTRTLNRYRRIEWGILDSAGVIVERIHTNEGADFEKPMCRRRWGMMSRLMGLDTRARPDHPGINRLLDGRVLLVELGQSSSYDPDIKWFIEWDEAEPDLMIAAEAYQDLQKAKKK